MSGMDLIGTCKKCGEWIEYVDYRWIDTKNDPKCKDGKLHEKKKVS